MPRRQFQGQMSHCYWSKVHMAAYKRPATAKVKKSHRISATSQTLQIFLSPFSYDQTHQKPENHKNTEQFLRTLNFSRIKFKWNSVKIVVALRDSMLNLHHWANFPYNSSANSPLEAANSSAIAEEDWEEEGKKIQRIWTGEEEEEEITDLFSDSSQEINKQNRNSRVLEDSGSNLRLKHR